MRRVAVPVGPSDGRPLPPSRNRPNTPYGLGLAPGAAVGWAPSSRWHRPPEGGPLNVRLCVAACRKLLICRSAAAMEKARALILLALSLDRESPRPIPEQGPLALQRVSIRVPDSKVF